MEENTETQTLPLVTDDEQPESIEPETEPEGDNRKRKHLVAGIVAGVAVLAIGAGAWGLIAVNQHKSAVAACSDSVSQIEKATAKLATAKTAAKDASAIAGDQVKDPAVVTVLAKDLKTVSSKSLACPADGKTADLNRIAQENKDHAKDMTSAATATTKDTKRVVESKAQKDLDTATAGLDSKLGEAKTLLDSSNGAVGDEGTRQSLQQQIEESTATKDDAKRSLDQVKESTGKLEAAMKKVSDSVAAKQAADQASAAAAAAAQQQRAAAGSTARTGASSSGTKSYGFTKSYTAPRRSTSGTTSTPRKGGSSAPRQTTPKTSGSSSSGPCVATPTGHGNIAGGNSTWDSYSYSGNCGW